MGVQGGSEVEILLIYLETAQNFKDSLPNDTQAQIARGDEGPFPNYPIYSTGVTLSASQVNLLAAQGEYSVMQNVDMVKHFLGPNRFTGKHMGEAYPFDMHLSRSLGGA